MLAVVLEERPAGLALVGEGGAKEGPVGQREKVTVVAGGLGGASRRAPRPACTGRQDGCTMDVWHPGCCRFGGFR